MKKLLMILILLGVSFQYGADGSYEGQTLDSGSGWEFNYNASGEYEGSEYHY
tara:strand:+ start:830 stop:985 length:156 start_codon:yes stop_codon:yes gene_type:complete